MISLSVYYIGLSVRDDLLNYGRSDLLRSKIEMWLK